MKFFRYLVLILIFELFGVLLFVYSGFYNMAATDHHTRLVRWGISTFRDRSVETRARHVAVPPLNDPEMQKVGMEHYHEMCESCHGGPGLGPGEFARGLYPAPPDLADSAGEMPPSQIFWIVKYGLKMTGMPAFSVTHNDSQIWAIVSFVEQLPKLSPEKYREMLKSAGLKPGQQEEEKPQEGEPSRAPEKDSGDHSR